MSFSEWLTVPKTLRRGICKKLSLISYIYKGNIVFWGEKKIGQNCPIFATSLDRLKHPLRDYFLS